MQNYTFSSKPPRKSKEIYKLSANNHEINRKLLTVNCYSQAVPSRKTWRRPLMVRQPLSEAVPSTGGRFSSSSLRGEDREERWSLL